MKAIIKIVLKFLKDNSLWIILGLILFFAASMAFQKCRQDNIDNTIDQVELNKLRRRLIDSIETKAHEKYIQSIDSINAVREAERKQKNKVIASLDKERQKLKKERQDIYNRVDTLDLTTCKKVVEKQEEIIESQDTAIVKRDEVIESYKMSLSDYNNKYEAQVKETQRVNILRDQCEGDVNILQKKLEKENTWWKRNEKWIYFGAGVLGTTLLLKWEVNIQTIYKTK